MFFDATNLPKPFAFTPPVVVEKSPLFLEPNNAPVRLPSTPPMMDHTITVAVLRQEIERLLSENEVLAQENLTLRKQVRELLAR